MGRPRTGSTFEKNDILQISVLTDRPNAKAVRFTRPAGLDEHGRPVTKSDARLAALDLQTRYDRGLWDPWADVPDAPAAHDITVEAWSKLWLASRRARGLLTVDDDEARVRDHVLVHIGHCAMRTIARRELETLVQHLDKAVRAKRISGKTGQNIWGNVTKMFDDAMRSKDTALRVRDDNPTKLVRGPDRTPRKLRTYLYPTEFLQLVSCEDVAIEWRRKYALATYLYFRRGEVQGIACTDIDLERGVALVHQAHHRVRGHGQKTKTDAGTRRILIEPNVLPLLRVMIAESHGRIQVMPHTSAEKNAARLREHLEAAGVKRAELFEGTDTTARITFHDLRATGITWAAIRGDAPLAIEQMAGHTDFATTQKYIREAQALGRAFGELFPQLPQCLLENSSTRSSTPPFSNDTKQRGSRAESDMETPGVEPEDTSRTRTSVHESAATRQVLDSFRDLASGITTRKSTRVELANRVAEASLWDAHDLMLLVEQAEED